MTFPRLVFPSLLLTLFFFLAPVLGQDGPHYPAEDGPQGRVRAANASVGVTETPIAGETNAVRVTFASPVVTPYPVNNIVTAYLFLPTGAGPHPAMVVLHEWNPGSTESVFRICRILQKAGVVAMGMVEPYSLNRASDKTVNAGAHILTDDVPQMRAAMMQAIADARKCFDYLQSRPDIDGQKLGVVGVSLGGILSGLVAKEDARVSLIITLVGGANFAQGFWNGLLTRRFRGGLKRRGYGFDRLQSELSSVEASDYPRAFNPDNALIIDGRYDAIVLPGQAKKLGETLGGAPVTWLNTGHYGAATAISPVTTLVTRFVRARFFGDGAFRQPNTLPSRTLKAGILLGGREYFSPAVAYQFVNFDAPGKVSLDGQLTRGGLNAALSFRVGLFASLGLSAPLRSGPIHPRPFVLLSVTL